MINIDINKLFKLQNDKSDRDPACIESLIDLHYLISDIKQEFANSDLKQLVHIISLMEMEIQRQMSEC